MLGLGLAFALDLLNPVIRTPAQMERELDLRPVISIPELKTGTPNKKAMSPQLLEKTKPLQSISRYAVVIGAGFLLMLAMTAMV